MRDSGSSSSSWEGERTRKPIEQERNCDLCDNMNTKKDPAITRKDEDEDEDEAEAEALGLGFSLPAKPSQAQVAAAETGGDRRPRREKDASSRIEENTEVASARAHARGLRRPHECRVSRMRWCGERGPVLCGNSIRVSFF